MIKRYTLYNMHIKMLKYTMPHLMLYYILVQKILSRIIIQYYRIKKYIVSLYKILYNYFHRDL